MVDGRDGGGLVDKGGVGVGRMVNRGGGQAERRSRVSGLVYAGKEI